MGLLGVVLLSRCAGCGVPGAALCEQCLTGLVRIAPPVCERCGCPGAWPVRRCVECAGRRLAFARARGAVVYDAHARPLVSAWKERGRRDLAGVFASVVDEVVMRPDADVVTFVPGDRERGRERGHLPARQLGRALGASGGCPPRRCSSAPRARDARQGFRGRSAARTSAAPSQPAPRLRRGLSSWTTSTRPERPRRRARRPSGAPERGASTSCAWPARCARRSMPPDRTCRGAGCRPGKRPRRVRSRSRTREIVASIIYRWR